MFFKNLVDGKDPKECPDNDGHNVDAIDALTIALPVIIRYSDSERELRNEKVIEAIRTLRNVSNITNIYAIALADLTVDILEGKDLRAVTTGIAGQVGIRNFDKVV